MIHTCTLHTHTHTHTHTHANKQLPNYGCSQDKTKEHPTICPALSSIFHPRMHFYRMAYRLVVWLQPHKPYSPRRQRCPMTAKCQVHKANQVVATFVPDTCIRGDIWGENSASISPHNTLNVPHLHTNSRRGHSVQRKQGIRLQTAKT